MSNATELTLENCFWHADVLDIDFSQGLAAIRIVTAPEVVPCMPDPRALTSVTFFNVSSFKVTPGKSNGSSSRNEYPRCWSVDTATTEHRADGLLVQISGVVAPEICVACKSIQCELLPIETLAKTTIKANRSWTLVS